jgi:hypothetical protein
MTPWNWLRWQGDIVNREVCFLSVSTKTLRQTHAVLRSEDVGRGPKLVQRQDEQELLCVNQLRRAEQAHGILPRRARSRHLCDWNMRPTLQQRAERALDKNFDP